MPPVIEAHFFAPNDLNGDTIFECSSDDSFFKGVKLDIQRDKLGSGQVTFARRVPLGLFTNDILKPEVFVRFLRAKVDCDGEHRLIHTDRGVGYSLRSTEW